MPQRSTNPDPGKRCPSCNASVPQESKKCPQCGYDIYGYELYTANMTPEAREQFNRMQFGNNTTPAYDSTVHVATNFSAASNTTPEFQAYQGGATSATPTKAIGSVSSAESPSPNNSTLNASISNIDPLSVNGYGANKNDPSSSDSSTNGPSKSKKTVATIAGAAIVFCVAAILIAASMGAFNGASSAPSNNGANSEPNNNVTTPTQDNNTTTPESNNNETTPTQDKSDMVSTASAGNYTITPSNMGAGWTPGTTMVPSYMYSNANSSTNTLIYYNSTTETVAEQSTYVFVFNSIADASSFLNSTIASYGSSYTITNLTSPSIGDVTYQTTSHDVTPTLDAHYGILYRQNNVVCWDRIGYTSASYAFDQAHFNSVVQDQDDLILAQL
jgi:hypothetical protein